MLSELPFGRKKELSDPFGCTLSVFHARRDRHALAVFHKHATTVETWGCFEVRLQPRDDGGPRSNLERSAQGALITFCGLITEVRTKAHASSKGKQRSASFHQPMRRRLAGGRVPIALRSWIDLSTASSFIRLVSPRAQRAGKVRLPPRKVWRTSILKGL